MQKPIIISGTYNQKHWDIYIKCIKEAINSGKGVIILTPQLKYIEEASERISRILKLSPFIISRRQSAKKQLTNWLAIKNSKTPVVIGARSAVFAPVDNLGLIIVDQESDTSLKQKQSPFYHARDIALMRSKLADAKIILSSQSLSLESLYLAKKNKLKVFDVEEKTQSPSVSILDMKDQFSIRRRKYPLISLTLETRMQKVLEQKGRILIFHNRRGFARTMKCKKCGFKLSCNRCDVDLIHNHKEKKLVCPYCNYKQDLVTFCPQCRSSYIQFKSPGVEKLESELYRLFPHAKIRMFDADKTISNFDILVATQKIFGNHLFSQVDLVGVISADILWNRSDFRAQEKAFGVLLKLKGLAKESLVIQTFFSEHILLRALKRNDNQLFYKQELSDRRRLRFPPFRHLINIHLRGINQSATEKLSQRLSDKIKQSKLLKNVEIISSYAGLPKKLRGTFRFEVLLRTKTIDENLIQGLRSVINRISHPKVVVSVDVDPL